ncbi:MAG: nucleotidyltransferase domain-containing protein [Candidatus Rokubacteria bacterium]|nr:nucleotidyltransferase domain-containing protein [Candidatus Rokubacteria bacterium]
MIDHLRRQLEGRPEILCAYLHGSFLKGDPYRDIDVAVWVDPTRRGARSRAQYALDLSVALHVALRCPVDVQVLNDAPLAFRYHALNGHPLVVRDWEWLDEVRARIWDDYFDFAPFARQYLREALGA